MEGRVMRLINKRLFSLKKKLKTKPSVSIAIRELEKLKPKISLALADQIHLSKDAAVNDLEISRDNSSDRYRKNQRCKKLHSNKKRKTLHDEPTDNKSALTEIEDNTSPEKAHLVVSTIETVSNIDGSLFKPTAVSGKKRKLKKNTTASEESDTDDIENQDSKQKISDNLIKEPLSSSTEEKIEVASQLDEQHKKGTLWAQKSSWTDLVGGTNASFSISLLLPDSKFDNQEQVKQPINWFAVKQTVHEPKESEVKSSSGVTLSDSGSKTSLGAAEEKLVRAPVRYTIGETCSFMRSDASMKEWKSTKAALSASLKKKTDKNK